MNPKHRDNMKAAHAARLAEARSAPPPPHPPGSDRRPLPGFSHHYAIDRDKVAWSCIGHSGWPGPWRPLKVVMRGRLGRRACVQLTALDGRRIFRSVASLHRAAFLRPKLPAQIIFPDWYDDEGDEEADVKLPPRPTRATFPVRPVRAIPPLLRPKTEPAKLDDLDDGEPRPIPLPAVPRSSSPAPPHPGGPAELGPLARGSGNGRARLDEVGVVEMRRLRTLGWSTGRLASHFGVARNTVCLALNGKTWGHVATGVVGPGEASVESVPSLTMRNPED